MNGNRHHTLPIWRRRTTAMACLASLSVGLVAACGSSPSQTTAAANGSSKDVAAKMASSCGGAKSDWSTLISAAQKEGDVSIAGPPNPTVNQKLPEAFENRFGINVKYQAGSSGKTAQKIKSERAAGIYSLDDFLAGGNTMSTVIYASKWLKNLKANLVSPTLTKAATWKGHTKGAPFVDQPAHSYVARVSIQGQSQFIFNTKLAKGQIKGWHDLLNPKWKGKIVSMDPTKGSGLAFNVAVMLSKKLGPNFVKKLYKGQHVILETNDRQAADAVAKGQYAVGIGISEANGQLDQLIHNGLPIKTMTHPNDAPEMVSAGYGELGLMAKAPHPAAAKLFANWILCPSGNKAWNSANHYQSARTDVHINDVPDFIKADVSGNYWDTYGWELLTSNQTDKVLKQLNNELS